MPTKAGSAAASFSHASAVRKGLPLKPATSRDFFILAGTRAAPGRPALAIVLVVAIVVLLVVSMRNTWDLLVTVGAVTLGVSPEKD
ncbi:MAG TPA: hypothetical protein VND96_11065 [Candidatus Micrarchaeaceae archaeon]|nr:hypothetical protein [Candidatus Micrarchaeaceae archaeon]